MIDKLLFLVSILLLFSVLKSFGQGTPISSAELSHLMDSLADQKQLPVDNNSKEALMVVNLTDSRPNYVYNDSKDTIKLSSINPFGLCNCTPFKVISEVQIDNKGAKEIVFYRACHFIDTYYKSSFRQTTESTIKKYEIWNLDTKQLLFEAQNYCKSNFDNENPSGRGPNRKKGISHYQYNFTINKNGDLQIKHLRGNLKHTVELKEGTYTFTNGKYVLKE